MPGHNVKVLIVEDEILLAMDTRAELDSMGYQVVGIASSSDTALALLSRETPDVILMDIVIQGNMSGIELTRVVSEKYPQCKVIYMTAYLDETTIAKVRQTRNAGVLNKPFEPYQLKGVIEASLGG